MRGENHRLLLFGWCHAPGLRAPRSWYLFPQNFTPSSSMNDPIIVRTKIPRAEIGHVFATYTTPADICRWNAASDDWHTPSAVLELRTGGRLCYRMEARDGSMGFDFEGTVELVTPPHRLAYRIDDGRAVDVTFTEVSGGVDVEVRFEAEQVHARELQAQGWQAILDRFAAIAVGRNSA